MQQKLQRQGFGWWVEYSRSGTKIVGWKIRNVHAAGSSTANGYGCSVDGVARMAKSTSAAGAICTDQIYVLRVVLRRCSVVSLAVMRIVSVDLMGCWLRVVVLCT